MSPQLVGEIARKSCADIDELNRRNAIRVKQGMDFERYEDLVRLAGIGDSGVSPSNSHRDLLRMFPK